MPKSAKMPDDFDKPMHEAQPPAQPMRPGNNGFDGAELQGFIDEIRAEQDKIDEIMRNAQEACEPYRQEIATIKKAAAEAGFSKTEFNTVLRKFRLEAKLEAIDEKLDDDQKGVFEQMLHALGQLTLPLGDTPAANGKGAH